jgi:peptidylprolyl isomerase
VSNPVKDRSGRGLPPKAERRAAGKAANLARMRARRRRQLLRSIGSAAAVVVVVGGLAVACTHLNASPKTPAAASTPTAAAPSCTESPAGHSSAPVTTVDPSFDAALKTRPTVTAGTGDLTKLVVTPVVTGKGPAVACGQTISVNYVGAYYKTGEVFQASWDSQPASFAIGVGAVIPGWDQGLVGVTVGSRVQLDIPAGLAYGADASTTQGKPAGPLRFVVDILGAAG